LTESHSITLPAPALIPHVVIFEQVAWQLLPHTNPEVLTWLLSSTQSFPHEAVQFGTLLQLEAQPLLQTNPQM
jgi:hypothetical protein